MRGFTERFVGEYQQGVWDDEMWNDFMEVDVEATNKRDGLDKDGNVKMPYVVPESFKVQKKVRVVLPGVLPAQAGKGLPPVKIELEIVVRTVSLVFGPFVKPNNPNLSTLPRAR